MKKAEAEWELGEQQRRQCHKEKLTSFAMSQTFSSAREKLRKLGEISLEK